MRIKKDPAEKKPTETKLEDYLKSCPNFCDFYDFENHEDAYKFGKNLREIAMKEEGVTFPDQMEKFDVEISLQRVRIKLLVVNELVSC